MAAITSCTPLVNNADRTAINVRDTANATAERVADYFTYKPTPKPEAQPIQERYCYTVLTDILCYADPNPQLAKRLTGVQTVYGDNTVIVMNTPAEIVAPTRDAIIRNNDAKPIFVGDAPSVKEAKTLLRADEQPSNSELY